MTKRSPSGEASPASRDRAADTDTRDPPSPVELLLDRVLVVKGSRAADLSVELEAEGISTRTAAAESIKHLIAGLVIVEDRAGIVAVAEGMQTLRRRGSAVACVVLSPRPVADHAALLAAVADVVLPADAPAALVAAQLRSLARIVATKPPTAEPEMISVREITVDLRRREARAGGRLLTLTPIEFRLLALLARRPGVVSHVELFQEVYAYDATPAEVSIALKAHIWRIRAKLAEAALDYNAIVNVRGFGYVLERREPWPSGEDEVNDG